VLGLRAQLVVTSREAGAAEVHEAGEESSLQVQKNVGAPSG
jgi:hypothetical protein